MKIPIPNPLRIPVPSGLVGRFLGVVATVAMLATVATACDVHGPTGAGSLSSITVSPNPTLAVNARQQFLAVGRDAEGTVVEISPTWSILAGGGAVDADGMFTAGTAPGVYTATVQATSGDLSGTATVTVVIGEVATITVAPNPDTLAAGATGQFTAVGRDSGGNLVAISPVWSVAAGGGTISGTGVFTAGAVGGTFASTVRATSGAVFGSATVVVTAPVTPTPPDTTSPTPPDSTPTTPPVTPPVTPTPATTIVVTPNPDTLAVGTTQQFTAVGRNASGAIVTIAPVWSVAAGGGSISPTGLFTAGTVSGTFTNSVRATSGTVFGSATVVVTAAVPPPVIPLINLGAAATHGILAGSTITCVALGTVNADASVWPGSAITGFPPCVITGARHAADAYAQTAQGALTAAYNQLDALPCGVTITANLGGQTLRPGVYCSTSSVAVTGEMFFDALGDSNATLVIEAASTLTTAGARITLLNGAQARNIHWLVKSSATIGLGSAMKGNIIAFTSITMNDNSTLLGRALARNGAVTLGSSDTITLP